MRFDLSRRIEGGSRPSYLKHREFRTRDNGGESHWEFLIREITMHSDDWPTVIEKVNIVEG
jgi:hypothetical protein